MLIAIVCGLLAMGSAFGMDWKTIEIGGIRYVALAQVADFYRLENLEATGDGVILKNQDITLNFEADSREASFNKVGFRLERKLQKKEEAYYLSRTCKTGGRADFGGTRGAIQGRRCSGLPSDDRLRFFEEVHGGEISPNDCQVGG